jgi:hypothetical protein
MGIFGRNTLEYLRPCGITSHAALYVVLRRYLKVGARIPAPTK